MRQPPFTNRAGPLLGLDRRSTPGPLARNTLWETAAGEGHVPNRAGREGAHAMPHSLGFSAWGKSFSAGRRKSRGPGRGRRALMHHGWPDHGIPITKSLGAERDGPAGHRDL